MSCRRIGGGGGGAASRAGDWAAAGWLAEFEVEVEVQVDSTVAVTRRVCLRQAAKIRKCRRLDNVVDVGYGSEGWVVCGDERWRKRLAGQPTHSAAPGPGRRRRMEGERKSSRKQTNERSERRSGEVR